VRTKRSAEAHLHVDVQDALICDIAAIGVWVSSILWLTTWLESSRRREHALVAGIWQESPRLPFVPQIGWLR
jgi:hypothetical protein